MNRQGFLKLLAILPAMAAVGSRSFTPTEHAQQITIAGKLREDSKKNHFMVGVVEEVPSQGALVDKTTWFVVFAPNVGLKKGDLVRVTGRLKSDKYGNCYIRSALGAVPVARFKIIASSVEAL